MLIAHPLSFIKYPKHYYVITPFEEFCTKPQFDGSNCSISISPGIKITLLLLDLPDGFSFNTKTGEIKGNCVNRNKPQTYTITGKNYYSTITTTISLSYSSIYIFVKYIIFNRL